MIPPPARLFVALELPVAVRDALDGWGAEQLGPGEGLRRVDPGALHLTLCFLGSRPLADVEAIGDACAGLADQPSPALALGRMLWLPQGRPRVVAIELEDRRRRLAGLQDKLSRALTAGGWYVPEPRPYLAHVTLARASRGARVRPRPLPTPAPMSFTASELALLRSRLERPSAARYERLATVRLATSAAPGPGFAAPGPGSAAGDRVSG